MLWQSPSLAFSVSFWQYHVWRLQAFHFLYPKRKTVDMPSCYRGCETPKSLYLPTSWKVPGLTLLSELVGCCTLSYLLPLVVVRAGTDPLQSIISVEIPFVPSFYNLCANIMISFQFTILLCIKIAIYYRYLTKALLFLFSSLTTCARIVKRWCFMSKTVSSLPPTEHHVRTRITLWCRTVGDTRRTWHLTRWFSGLFFSELVTPEVTPEVAPADLCPRPATFFS